MSMSSTIPTVYYTLFEDKYEAFRKAKELIPIDQIRLAYLRVVEPTGADWREIETLEQWTHSTYYLVLHPYITTNKVEQMIWKMYPDLFQFSDIHECAELHDIFIYNHNTHTKTTNKT